YLKQKPTKTSDVSKAVNPAVSDINACLRYGFLAFADVNDNVKVKEALNKLGEIMMESSVPNEEISAPNMEAPAPSDKSATPSRRDGENSGVQRTDIPPSVEVTNAKGQVTNEGVQRTGLKTKAQNILELSLADLQKAFNRNADNVSDILNEAFNNGLINEADLEQAGFIVSVDNESSRRFFKIVEWGDPILTDSGFVEALEQGSLVADKMGIEFQLVVSDSRTEGVTTPEGNILINVNKIANVTEAYQSVQNYIFRHELFHSIVNTNPGLAKEIGKVIGESLLYKKWLASKSLLYPDMTNKQAMEMNYAKAETESEADHRARVTEESYAEFIRDKVDSKAFWDTLASKSHSKYARFWHNVKELFRSIFGKEGRTLAEYKTLRDLEKLLMRHNISVQGERDIRISKYTEKVVDINAGVKENGTRETGEQLATKSVEQQYKFGDKNQIISKSFPEWFQHSVLKITTTGHLKSRDGYELAKKGTKVGETKLATREEGLKAGIKVIDALFSKDRSAYWKILKDVAIKHPKAIVVYPNKVENETHNWIPLAFAMKIMSNVNNMDGVGANWEIGTSVEQINTQERTGVEHDIRIKTPCKFTGEVESGRVYVIVDDVYTQGGTINQLKNYIEDNGGTVVYVTTLAVGMGQGDYVPNKQTITELVASLRLYDKIELYKFQKVLEKMGYDKDFTRLTEKQLQQFRTEQTLDYIRERMASYGSEGGNSLYGKMDENGGGKNLFGGNQAQKIDGSPSDKKSQKIENILKELKYDKDYRKLTEQQLRNICYWFETLDGIRAELDARTKKDADGTRGKTRANGGVENQKRTDIGTFEQVSESQAVDSPPSDKKSQKIAPVEQGENSAATSRDQIPAMFKDKHFVTGKTNRGQRTKPPNYNEDASRKRAKFAAANFAIVRKMVLNILKKDTSKVSLKGKRKKAGWNNNYLLELVGTFARLF
ncbi:MAG: hypothetical protein FWG20_04490, partial [Candidatus Cloacimonetes bacterium]|nr:hypothetical protein [Candidatus Cloacimonadota bacterium]